MCETHKSIENLFYKCAEFRNWETSYSLLLYMAVLYWQAVNYIVFEVNDHVVILQEFVTREAILGEFLEI